MLDGPIEEEKWETLQQRKEEFLPGSGDSAKGAETKLPPEMVDESPKPFTDEQRQNLYQKILGMGIPQRLSLSIFGNREARNLLIRDPNKIISLAVLKNAKLNENEVLRFAQRRDLSQEIILAIANDPKWRKSYLVKFALVSNPKTPLSVGMNLLPNLYDKELKLLSRDVGVSPLLRQKARENLLQRNAK